MLISILTSLLLIGVTTASPVQTPPAGAPPSKPLPTFKILPLPITLTAPFPKITPKPKPQPPKKAIPTFIASVPKVTLKPRPTPPSKKTIPTLTVSVPKVTLKSKKPLPTFKTLPLWIDHPVRKLDRLTKTETKKEIPLDIDYPVPKYDPNTPPTMLPLPAKNLPQVKHTDPPAAKPKMRELPSKTLLGPIDYPVPKYDPGTPPTMLPLPAKVPHLEYTPTTDNEIKLDFGNNGGGASTVKTQEWKGFNDIDKIDVNKYKIPGIVVNNDEAVGGDGWNPAWGIGPEIINNNEIEDSEVRPPTPITNGNLQKRGIENGWNPAWGIGLERPPSNNNNNQNQQEQSKANNGWNPAWGVGPVRINNNNSQAQNGGDVTVTGAVQVAGDDNVENVVQEVERLIALIDMEFIEKPQNKG